MAATTSTSADDIPSFQPLGVLPGYLWSGASDATPDGSVVVGASRRYDPYEYEACRWTLDGQIMGLGDLPGGPVQSSARGVSADGNVIVGFGTHATSRRHAFRWTSEEGMVDLGDFPGGIDDSEAWDVSADGQVVVGFGAREHTNEAFRWTLAQGMIGLGFAPGYSGSEAIAVAPDGSVIVGACANEQAREAFRWTEQGGFGMLGDLPGSWFDSIAANVSADGQTGEGCCC